MKPSMTYVIIGLLEMILFTMNVSMKSGGIVCVCWGLSAIISFITAAYVENKKQS